MKVSVFLQRFAAVLVLVAGFSVLAIGCGDNGDGSTEQEASQVQQAGSTSTVTTLSPELAGVTAEELSTFRSKDPFIQQAVSTTATSGSGSSTTANVSSSTTYQSGSTTTYRTTTTKYSGSTTTTKASTTTTTAPHVHTLKILSVGNVGGTPAVTFQVDGSVYKEKRVGDVVSSSWGQIKVLDLNSSSKVATLLQGSETLVLSVGQVVYE